AQDAGRDPTSIGIEGRVYARDGNLASWVKRTEEWRSLDATHISISTMGVGYTASEHIDALRRYSESLMP
ncbi:MAG: LLM class F420-dependent oxidoreductase, partial [Ktedonobacteraceae bacterium]|nr:LLM class F420-dependent oxidoreductase [Ktedonobacteraceae bacterium]